MCDAPMKVPATAYADPTQYAEEIEKIHGWLAGVGKSLATLRLDELYPYRVPTTLARTCEWGSPRSRPGTRPAPSTQRASPATRADAP